MERKRSAMGRHPLPTLSMHALQQKLERCAKVLITSSTVQHDAGACNQSLFPREQETLCEICDEPIFRDQPVAELTGHHIAPHDLTSRGREALELTLVCAPERPLPGKAF